MTTEFSPKCCVPTRESVYVPKQHPNDKTLTNNDKPDNTSRWVDTVCVGGDWFDMGCTEPPHPDDGEGPVRRVWIDHFRLAAATISNLQFRQFVNATGYKTTAERAGSSFVFHLFIEGAEKYPASTLAPWWRDVPGACWKSPEGGNTSIHSRQDHPVVHISREDALQYCRWSGTRLPTEAEWEFGARGGLASQPFPWGDELLANGDHHCNIWQGEFPLTNTSDDGFTGTAPATAYSSNAFGLFNMTGNVWEWVADRFTNRHSPRPVKNPKGPLNGNRFVAKGGSYLCHKSYCLRYRTSSRQGLPADTSTGNLGFRVAIDIL